MNVLHSKCLEKCLAHSKTLLNVSSYCLCGKVQVDTDFQPIRVDSFIIMKEIGRSSSREVDGKTRLFDL